MSAKRKEACQSCRWFGPPYEESSDGRCRRYPPRVVPDTREGPDTFWPVVEVNDYCGEWASKSTKAKEVTK